MNPTVCVIGSGPSGITLALELAKKDINVVLVESGEANYNQEIQQLSDAIIKDKSSHSEMNLVVRRQLGGTSVIWGGRCVPLDPIDFEKRDYIPNSGWPISYEEVAKYFGIACEYLHCGKPDFSATTAIPTEQPTIVPGLPEAEILSTSLERWSLPTDFWKHHKDQIKDHQNVKLVTGLTCVDLIFSESKSKIVSAKFSSINQQESTEITADYFVLACGGLESTRLLMNVNELNNAQIGNQGGKLGLYYMGHISGKISNISFSTPAEFTSFGFDKDRDNIYCRKRFTLSEKTQKDLGVSNTTFWLDNPPIFDPKHKNGILSAAYLALSLPVISKYLGPEAIVKRAVGQTNDRKIFAHLGNIFTSFFSSISWAVSFVYKRYFRTRKIPGFFVYNADNKYTLHYHCEHIASKESHVKLSNEKDAVGLKRLAIHLKYQDQDYESVVAAHKVLDEHLRKNNCGNLIYKNGDLKSLVASQASDGFHQIGTTRMSVSPEDGVVDTNCKVHGTENLFVASSSVFPTSGQGNPTLTILALAARLADHLKTKP